MLSSRLQDSPDATLTRLARENPRHLRWLQGESGVAFTDEDLPDLLQDAHAEAIEGCGATVRPSSAIGGARRVVSPSVLDDGGRRAAPARRAPAAGAGGPADRRVAGGAGGA